MLIVEGGRPGLVKVPVTLSDDETAKDGLSLQHERRIRTVKELDSDENQLRFSGVLEIV